ncbi:MAG: hypothetical protein IIA61_10355 [Candidatus Marinimicrobia bacterium]|nr:hypothetical protein [Candidatus Neomarinimicrobiota bacterium]
MVSACPASPVARNERTGVGRNPEVSGYRGSDGETYWGSSELSRPITPYSSAGVPLGHHSNIPLPVQQF